MNAADMGLPRRLIYGLLIVLAAATTAGHILAVTRLYEPRLHRAPDSTDTSKGPWPAVRPKPMPTIGANDRSRWATIRALVDDGAYAIGHRLTFWYWGNWSVDYGNITDEGWNTIDKVLKPGTGDFYSSKPPFLATLLAGEYWALRETCGWSITDENGYAVRTILLTVNWLPFVFYLIVLARMADQFGTSDWGRVFVLAAGCFATYLMPFAITLNNHSVAAWSALFALYFAFRQWSAPGPPRMGLALAGFFAGFTACNELPAVSFAAALFAIVFIRWPLHAVLFFLPAAALPVAGSLATNYLALGQWTPAYGEFGGPWYNFEGSHWNKAPESPKPGIDWAWTKESIGAYAFHLVAGHHGLFSLTPVFVLSLAGMGIALLRREVLRPVALIRRVRSDAIHRAVDGKGSNESGHYEPVRMLLAVLALVLTATLLGFYILVTDVRTHNYGGWTNGPRQLMWLTPLLLLAALPAADWLGKRRWGRALAYVLFGLSVLSVSYASWNPWRHPWIYDFMESRGVLPY
jgi:hypothetical protein